MTDSHELVLPTPVRLGWMGTGVMGRPMCEHLLRAGFFLTVFTRTPSKAQTLLEQGAVWAESPQELVEGVDVILTMLGFPVDIRALYLDREGILDHGRPGQILVDLTTSEPSLARTIYQEAQTKGMHSLDAPVSGGDIGAKNGTLSIMVGGDEPTFQAVQSLLSVFGQTVVYHGKAGAGQHAKMCNQITIAGTMIGVCEALLYARQAGLDGEALLNSIRKGAAGCWTLDHLAPKMMDRDFTPGFYVEHFLKDMGIALSEAQRMGLLLPGLMTVRKVYQVVQSLSHGRSGTHALLLALEHLSPKKIVHPIS